MNICIFCAFYFQLKLNFLENNPNLLFQIGKDQKLNYVDLNENSLYIMVI